MGYSGYSEGLDQPNILQKHIELHYAPFTYEENRKLSDNLDGVINHALLMRSARDAVRSKFCGDVECDIKVGTLGGNERYPGFFVLFGGRNSEKIEAALDVYFSIAEIPHLIMPNSELDIVNRALKMYNKVLCNGIIQRFIGGHRVVDLVPT